MMSWIASPVLSDTANVSIKWYIPSDTTLEVEYPIGYTSVDFRPGSRNFSDLGADGQATPSTYAFNVTNNGNVDIDIEGAFTTDMPTNVTWFNISTTMPTDATDYDFMWKHDNDTVGQAIITSLSPQSKTGFFANTSGVMVENTTYPFSKTFQLTSSAS